MDGSHVFIIFVSMVLSTYDVHAIITNLTLVDGVTRNEGRVEYVVDGNSFSQAICGPALNFDNGMVICRELGYPGLNNFFHSWPFLFPKSVSHRAFLCNGDEDKLQDCGLGETPDICFLGGGVICYDHGYQGCFSFSGSMSDYFHAICTTETETMTIPKCVNACNNTDESFIYAGLYDGNCLCTAASLNMLNASQSQREHDTSCNRVCSGRNIEHCGGLKHIAIFHIEIYLGNDHVNTSNDHCGAIPTPTTDTASTVYFQLGTEQNYTPTRKIASTENVGQETEQTDAMDTGSGSSIHPHLSIASSPSSPLTTSTERLISRTGPGPTIGIGVVCAIVIVYAIVITIFYFSLRRKFSTLQKESTETKLQPYMDLTPRSKPDKMYQDINQSVSQKTEYPHSQSSRQVYEVNLTMSNPSADMDYEEMTK